MACSSCEKEFRSFLKLNSYGGLSFKQQRKNFMMQSCKDCARQNCEIYMKAKEIGINDKEDLKKSCIFSLRRAEKIKKKLKMT